MEKRQTRTYGYLAFAVGICLTVWTCILVSNAQDARIRNNFQRDVDKVASDTRVRLQTYFDMLISIKGMFAVNDQVTRAQFAQFIGELNLAERYPGFQAIQFVRYVPTGQLGTFSDAVRRDTSLVPGGYPGFAVKAAPGRSDHYIIDFNEPMAGNEIAFGLDLATLPGQLAAVERGRDTGLIVATEPIALIQIVDGGAGFVARTPVYRQHMPLDTVEQRRAALVGMLAIVFRMNNLMSEVIDPALASHLAVRVHDAGINGAAVKRQLMYDSTRAGVGLVPGLALESTVDVPPRQWVMSFSAVNGARYSRNATNVILAGTAGFIISALVAALMIASSRSRNLALRLAVSLDEQRAFQDSASVGIALFSGGVIVRCNRGMEEIMGYDPGELTGKRTRILVHGGPNPFGGRPQMPRVELEAELVRKDGAKIWCLIHGKALNRTDLAGGGVWVIQDISDRKRTEAALKQAETNLITSEKMASLGALVAGIAHELNTPIGNSLLTATALADMAAEFEARCADGAVKRSALESHLADTRLACGILATSLRRAGDLITSFKQVAVDQTSDQRRRFDLCDVVRDTVATYSAQFKRANCEMEIDSCDTLVMDSYPGSVGQVLSNLINNALLHAFEGQRAGRITVRVHPVGDEQVLILFADNGAGMPARVMHQVFDPFFTTKMGQGGTGLGMNIVYNIVTGMLGGTVEIDSAPGKGTTVTIRVPKRAPDRSPALVPADDAQPLAST
ncbi:CHASE domain-containing protein [Massilia sp. GCM10020059]|uniref:histidine kinase n=1 Tax=Massilia agrisoli TaxID=2892444 RepID=A0ABS8IR48_9BURK|nr:CHASE domain-containing protein [Massilia agrisoli]MCC6071105.1 CHASE domain-containing protein [Massilia agrisoli]